MSDAVQGSYSTTAPLGPVASTVMLGGAVMVGAVLSRTLTEKVAVDLLSAASVAEQLTDVVPIGKVLSEAWSQVTTTEPSTASVAVALKVTTAPSGLVASCVMSPGTVSTGGVVSGQPSTVNFSEAGGTTSLEFRIMLAVFVKVPHCLGITLMVATKGTAVPSGAAK